MLLPLREFKTKQACRALVIALCGGAAATSLAGCSVTDALDSSETMTQGYVIDQQTLDLVPVGSSREQVLLALGTPSTTATFDNEAFYYISQKRVRKAAFMRPKLVDQQVLAVYFGDDNRVTKIAKYGMKDGKVFDFISRATPTAGKEQSFLAQIISGATSGQPPQGAFGG